MIMFFFLPLSPVSRLQCDVIGRDLEGKGFACTVLHGGKTQDIREESLAGGWSQLLL